MPVKLKPLKDILRHRPYAGGETLEQSCKLKIHEGRRYFLA